jgi:CubicO group peptidase (beta-lactamase class C family)
MSSGNFLGVSAGLLNVGCGTYVISSGYSDKRSLTKFQPNTITRIASITKPMTAIAIMQLYEQGRVDLDAPIQTYLPDFPSSEQPVTIRHLLSHTSGIPHYKSKIDAMSFSHYESLESAINAIFERGLISPAGEKYIYSSFGYTVLGRIIEVVSNDRFEEYLKKNIWQKAGMENTSLERSHSSSNKSRLYLKVGNNYLRSPYTDLSIVYPAGGVQSTTEDILKFGQSVLNDELLSRDTLEMMIDVRGSLAPEAGDDPYGLGWSVKESPDKGRIISHGGSQPGVSAHFQILLDKGVVSVALSNAFGTKSSAYILASSMGSLGM